MKYSVKIIGVPSRQDLADNLLSMILRDAPSARVEVFIDHERKGLGFNSQRAWLSEVHGDDDFRFVMQEDTIVCRDFYDTLGVAYSALLAAKGLAVPMFYANTIKQRRTIDKGFSWLAGGKKDAWGVCLGGPFSLMQEYVHWCRDTRNWAKYEHEVSKQPGSYGMTKFADPGFVDEVTFVWFLEMKGIPIYISAHSLIQHVGRNRSTLGHNTGGNSNMAQTFLGEDVSGLSIDWRKV